MYVRPPVCVYVGLFGCLFAYVLSGAVEFEKSYIDRICPTVHFWTIFYTKPYRKVALPCTLCPTLDSERDALQSFP